MHTVTSSWFFFSTHTQRCTDKHTSSPNEIVTVTEYTHVRVEPDAVVVNLQILTAINEDKKDGKPKIEDN